MFHWQGILVGLGCFLMIGLLHPVVIWGEYYFGKRIWPIFLLLGIACAICSGLTSNLVASSLIAVLGFCFFWCILELFHQERRVQKGWFPKNPKRTYKE